jgi:uncharacterized protein with PQ loop repeat
LNVAINENMMEDPVVWIGTVAGILVLLSFIPQIMKAYKIKKVFDVSIHLMILIASGMSLWVVYGVIRSGYNWNSYNWNQCYWICFECYLAISETELRQVTKQYHKDII